MNIFPPIATKSSDYKRALAVLMALLLTMLLNACAPIMRPEQANQTGIIMLKPGEEIGQTLVANFEGMNGIEVYLAPKDGAHGQVVLHLRAEPESNSDLGVAALPAESVTAPGFYRFPLPTQAHSRQTYYYFVLTLEGEGSLQVGRAPGAAYLDGSAYRNGRPADDAQLAFLLDYAPARLALGLAGEVLTWAWYLLLAGFLFVLPGWALLSFAEAPPRTPPIAEHKLAMRNGSRGDTLSAGEAGSKEVPPPLTKILTMRNASGGDAPAEPTPPHAPPPTGDGLAMRNTPGGDAPAEEPPPHAPPLAGEGLAMRNTPGSDAPAETTPPHAPPLAGEGLAMRNFWARLALSAGIGLALYPVLLLWTDLIGLHLGRGYALLPGALSLLWLGWREYIRWRETGRGILPKGKNIWGTLRARLSLPDITLVLLLALIVFSRFWVIRTLEGPMWGDGMQHTMITQLLLDHGGLFDSWQPYANIPTFTYHFGFHTASALFAWLTGLEARFATLWMGQILNIVGVFVLYPLAVRIGCSRWAGVGAVLVAGLLSPMPMFYLNWGRYTQLAGQVILPVVVALTWHWLDRSRNLTPRQLALGALLWAGLGLTHYRVLLFGILALAAYLVLHLKRWRLWFPNVAVLGAAGGLLFLPWFMHVFGGQILYMLQTQLRHSPDTLSAFTQSYNSIGRLDLYLPYPLWLALFLGAGITLWQRNRWGAVFALWMVSLFVLANPAWLHLPGTGAVNNFAVFIFAYAFAGIFIGSLLQVFTHELPALLSVILFLALALYGLSPRLAEIRPDQHAMLTRPDVRAGVWLQAHAQQENQVYINAFPAFVTTFAGADGGWWLALSAHRQPLIRPLNAGFETPLSEEEREQITRLYTSLQVKQQIDSADTLNLLTQNHIRYVYIGQQAGGVNYSGATLQPNLFEDNPAYRLAYHQDRVWIFEVRP